MHDILLSPIRLNELEQLIENSVRRVLNETHPDGYKPDDSDSLISVHQAAEFLNLSTPTIYSLVSRKEIPVSKPKGSKRLYFTKRQLSEWVKSGRQKTISEISDEAEKGASKQ